VGQRVELVDVEVDEGVEVAEEETTETEVVGVLVTDVGGDVVAVDGVVVDLLVLDTAM
jgi:hypothetical protein